MTELSRSWSLIFILIGMVIIGRSLLMFFRREYVFYNHTDLMWELTIVMFLGGAWCVAVGVLGLIDEKRRGKSK